MPSSVADPKYRMRAALVLLVMAVWTVAGLSPRTVLAVNLWHEELARHWAPCIFQAVQVSGANPLGRYDFVTGVDFDGDTRGGNNWENADDKRKLEFPLLPYVYYSVIETRSHYYITYSLFHPRDWRWYLAAEGPGAGAPLPATHENDLESATLVIVKDSGYGKLRLVGTVCHLQNYCFVTDAGIRPKSWAWDLSSGELQVSFFEDHPCLFVEAGGHGIGGLGRAMREDGDGPYSIGGKQYRFGSGAGVVYRYSEDPDYLPDAEPSGATAHGPDCEYQLVPLLSSLWPLRHDVGGSGMFEDTFDYEVAPGCVLEGLPVFIAAEGQDPGANPPWARDAMGDGLARGEWFFRPAQAMDRYLDEWPDRDMPGYDHYIRNPYIAGADTITVISPGGGSAWIVGYPMKIEWEITSTGPRLSDAARVYVSGNGGKMWRPVAVSAGEVPAHALWNVTGPAGDRCILAVRAGLRCDPNLTAVGYSPVFSISDPEAFTWSLLHSGGDGPARSHTQAVYDPQKDRLALFGGRSADLDDHNDTWVFDFGSMAWHRIHEGLDGAPEARSAHAAVYDTRGGRLLIHGGCGVECLDDTWALDLDTGLWHRLNTIAGDRRTGGVAIYDPVEDRLVVFGGSDGETLRNDVRALRLSVEPLAAAVCGGPPPAPAPATGSASPGDLEWMTLHIGEGPAPSARVGGAGAYDATRRWFVVYGGRGGDLQHEPLADVWAFSLDTYAWMLLDDGSGHAPPARWGHAASLDDRTGTLVVFGGTNKATSYSDVWLFEPDRLAWTEVTGGMMGPWPAPRSGAAAVLRNPGGRLVIACGRGAAGFEEDVWSMGLRSPTSPRQEPVQAGDETLNPGSVVWPNPSIGEVSIGLAVAASGHLRVAVYDVRGRLVRLIHDAGISTGYHTFHWEGKASDGAGVAGGVYFFKVSIDGRSYERPIVMLR